MSALRTHLNTGLLPPGYYALAEQSPRVIGPDVLTLEQQPPADAPANGNGNGCKVLA